MTLRETVADRISGGRITELAESNQELRAADRSHQADIAHLQESLGRLEQALYSADWRMLTTTAAQEFSAAGRRMIIELARIMRLKNPIIKRGVEVQRLYVWAQGVNISAEDERVNEVVQAFLDDERNRAELTTHQAYGEKEEELQQDGNLFFRLFINQQSGRVRIRTVDPLEISDIICNPEDSKEPWFYRRTYSKVGLDGKATQITELYPDFRYNPKSRLAQTPASSMDGRIIWDTPVYHVRVNRMGAWGICEYYSALDWARAYKTFLEQLATVWQALARWAWKLTVPGGKRGIAAAKTKLGTTLSETSDETNPPPLTGAIFAQSGETDMQPFRTSGATMKADDGRRILLMAASVFGWPETFWGDASVGSLATAESLDRPTELKIMDRQSLWGDVLGNIVNVAVTWAVRAPAGPLRSLGRVIREDDGDEWTYRLEWNANVKGAVTVDFPAIVVEDVDKQIGALIDAVTLQGKKPAGGVPLETAVRRMLSQLGFDNVDDIMALWQEEQEALELRRQEAMAAFSQNGAGGSSDEGGEQSDEEQAAAEALALIGDHMTAGRELLSVLRESANGH